LSNRKRLKLPKEGSREERILKTHYSTASKEQLSEWTNKYNFRRVCDFQWAVFRTLGLRRIKAPKKTKEDIHQKELVVELPAVNFRKVNINFGAGDSREQTVVVLASDGHAGKITRSYNKIVYRDRMEKMFDSIIKITTAHRQMYPIKNIRILNLGDNIQGENPYQGSKIGSVEMGARDQVKYIAAPRWNDFLGSLTQHFETVEMECFPGNHGHDKLAPETSSYDLLLYDVLEAGIGRYREVKIGIHDEFADIINIEGFRFFCFHGDGIPCQQGVPFFALDKKLKSWYMQYGGFDYAVGGHFHKRHHDEISSKLEYFMCSTLVSDDEWALKKLGISSNPSQWILGVHPRYGVTWRYALSVDDKFLPKSDNK